MASKKASQEARAESPWIDKAGAMGRVFINSEAVFNREWAPYLNVYDPGGNRAVYKKAQIDAIMEERIQIKGQPYSSRNTPIKLDGVDHRQSLRSE